jgi:hypothetical protein
MAGVAVLMAVASTSCEPVTDAGVRYVAIAEDGTVVATMAEYIIGSLESMQSATTSDGGRTWTNADKTYRKAGNESVQIPRGIYAIQSARVDLVSEDSVDSGLAPDLSAGLAIPSSLRVRADRRLACEGLGSTK